MSNNNFYDKNKSDQLASIIETEQLAEISKSTEPVNTTGKELCDCGKIAVWLYMPASSRDNNPFYCDDCVPRGCDCNYRYCHYSEDSDFNEYPDESDVENVDFIWIEKDKIWAPIDKKGRQYTCIGEYFYEDEGYDLDTTPIDVLNDMFDIKNDN